WSDTDAGVPRLSVREEAWPIAGAFVISRGAKREAKVVVVELEADGFRGRGESAPYPRYGETGPDVVARIKGRRAAAAAGADRAALQALLPPGAARNALDCALWALAAKRAGVRAWTLAGRRRLDPVKTAYTISLGAPEEMAQAAAAAARRPMLKLKIGG